MNWIVVERGVRFLHEGLFAGHGAGIEKEANQVKDTGWIVVLRADSEFLERFHHSDRVALTRGNNHAREAESRLVRELLSESEIEQHERAVRTNEDVSGMRVCLEKPVNDDLPAIGPGQRLGKGDAINPVSFQRLSVENTDAVDERSNQHASCDQALHGRRAA